MNQPSALSQPLSSIDELVSLFSSAAKPRQEWLVGLEHEKLGVRLDGSPVPYSGAGGVAELLAALVAERGLHGCSRR